MLGSKPKFYLFPATVALGALLLYLIANSKPPADRPAPLPDLLPKVSVLEVEMGKQDLWLYSQGLVEPALRTSLVAQVSGRVETVSPEFANGGSFRADEILVGIERADYEIALAEADAQLVDAKRALAVEKGNARQARREWRDLGSKDANELFLRKPQLAAAEASVDASQARLRKAQLDLKRTEITAPYDGFVLNKLVDVGRFVAAGTSIGEIFSSDRAEIRLPISSEERILLGNAVGAPAEVSVGRFQQEYKWLAKIARVESAVDSVSRQHYLVASLPDAFSQQGNVPPLVVGQFVQARVQAQPVPGAVRIPRHALRQPAKVWTLNDRNELEILDVQIVYRDAKEAVVKVTDNEAANGMLRVVTSNLSVVTPGMKVEVIPAIDDGLALGSNAL